MQTAFEFSAKAKTEIQNIIGRYPAGKQKSALLPLLHIAQEENGGWLSVDAMDKVAEQLGILSIEVYEVASFYSMFHLKKMGKYVIEVCRTGPCCNVGAEELIQYMEEKLGVASGETTADGLFTIKPVECLAACGTGPVLQIGPEYKYHENMTREKLDQLIEELRSKN
ncbi:MAG: NAD(P)H-dependent oxidoreductase subunit E [Saprospiraceae bacterium]|jgi:NADH-quinone oxidoreductase subunit E|nr:NAD(P)H-dependent oxidoreductase subunit E [Saprospiraceae bacterium]